MWKTLAGFSTTFFQLSACFLTQLKSSDFLSDLPFWDSPPIKFPSTENIQVSSSAGPMKDFLAPCMRKGLKSPQKPSVCLTALGLEEREPSQPSAHSTEPGSSGRARRVSSPAVLLGDEPEDLRMDFHTQLMQFWADPPGRLLWAKSRRPGLSGSCAYFAVEPACPDATSAKGTRGAAEQQPSCKAMPQQALTAARWSGWNQAKTTTSAGGCWGFGEHMQLQEKCVIISALLEKTQTNKSGFMGTFEILTIPLSRKSRTVAGSSSRSCLGAW